MTVSIFGLASPSYYPNLLLMRNAFLEAFQILLRDTSIILFTLFSCPQLMMASLFKVYFRSQKWLEKNYKITDSDTKFNFWSIGTIPRLLWLFSHKIVIFCEGLYVLQLKKEQKMVVFKTCHFFISHRVKTKKDSDKWTMGGSSTFKVVSRPHIITLKMLLERVAIYCCRWGIFFTIIVVAGKNVHPWLTSHKKSNACEFP